MANTFSIQRSARRMLRAGAVPGRSALRVELLEDRVVPSTTIPIAGTEWTPIGPSPVIANAPGESTIAPNNMSTGGRVVGVSPHPTQPNILYAATASGGVARSTNGGQTWTHLTDNLPANTPVLLAPTPVFNPAGTTTTLNALPGGGVLDRSLSMGSIGVNPLNPSMVFAGEGDGTQAGFSYAGRGLLRSLDAGNTWNLLKGPKVNIGTPANPVLLDGFDYAAITKIVYHPTDPETVFVVVNNTDGRDAGAAVLKPNAVWRTRNASAANPTWVDITSQLPQAGPTTNPVNRALTISDFNLGEHPDVGYVAVGFVGGDVLNGVYRTEKATTGDPSIADLSNPNSVRFEPRLGGTSAFAPGASNPIGTIKVTPAPGRLSTVYAILSRVTNTGGGHLHVYKSIDSGTSWFKLDATDTDAELLAFNPGMNAIDLLVDPTPNTDNKLFLAGRNGILVSTDGGGDFRFLSKAPGGANLIPPVIHNIRFDASRRIVAATDVGLYRLEDEATLTWASINGRSGEAGSSSPGGINGTGTEGGLGATQLFNVGLPPNEINFTQVGLAPQGTDDVIASTWLSGVINFTDPGGFNAPKDPLYGWPATDALGVGIGLGTGEGGSGGNIVYDFFEPNIVYRSDPTGSNFVKWSTDGGRTWAVRNNGIAAADPIFRQPAPPLEIDPSNNRRLFFGTDRVWATTDRGATWNQYGPAIPNVTGVGGANPPVITAIAIPRSSGDEIYVAVSRRNQAAPGNNAALYRYVPPPVNTWIDVSPGRFENNVINPAAPPHYDPVPLPNTTAVDNLFNTSSAALQGNALQGIITDIAVDPTEKNVVYVVTDTPGSTDPGGVSPRQHGPIDFSARRQMFRTINGGVNDNPLTYNPWDDISGDLPSINHNNIAKGLRIYSVALDNNRDGAPFGFNDDEIYIGTSMGVWKYTNANDTSPNWTRVGALPGADRELPDVMVRDIKLDTDYGVLAVATFGRGAWQYQIRPYISGFAFEDLNGNGFRDAGEGPAANLRIVAITPGPGGGPEIEFANVTTRSDGFYRFRTLIDGTYRIEVANSPTQNFQTTTPPRSFTVNETTTINTRDQIDGGGNRVFGADIGVFARTTVSGVKYDDLNGDGDRDAGEPGLQGWTIELVDPRTNSVVATRTTGVDGTYTFTNVGVIQERTGSSTPPETEYRLTDPTNKGYRVVPYLIREVVQPNWIQSGPTTAPAIPADSPAFAAALTPPPVGTYVHRLTSGTPLTGRDFGNFRPITVSGRKFEDVNGDGDQDVGEPGLGGWTITLQKIAADGSVISTDTRTTDANGDYSFTQVGPGTYRVREVLQNGWGQVTTNPADFPAISGQNRPGVNFGNFRFGTISGNVYEDTNGNGVRDAGENTPLVSATVGIFDPRTPAGPAVFTATTDAAGFYTITNLIPLERPGNTVPFAVRVFQPANLTQTIPDRQVTLNSGGTATGIDLLGFRRATATGVAFDDFNANGVRDAGEPLLPNFSVALFNAITGAQLATTTTDAAGNFTFNNLPPGTGAPVPPFRVGVAQAGWVRVPNAGGPPGSGPFSVTSGGAFGGLVVAAFRQVALSGVKFNDLDGDGVRDAGEPGLPGWTIQLRDGGGAVVGTAITDATGAYTLTVNFGPHTVREVGQGGWVQTTANPAGFTPTSGQVITGVNFGNFQLATVTGRVFFDQNGNGTQQPGEGPLGGFTVQLINAATGAVLASAVSDGNGQFNLGSVGPGRYQVREITPDGWTTSSPNPFEFTPTSGQNVSVAFGNFRVAAIFGTVFEDLDGSGLREPQEPAVAGHPILLRNAAGAVVRTVLTDADGNYQFADLPGGTYFVRLGNRPGWVQTTADPGTVSPASAQAVLGGSFGVLRLGSISGSVFRDSNRNFRRDSFETGVPGARVGLFDAAGTLVRDQVVGDNGAYEFLGLATGTYTVRLLDSTAGLTRTTPRDGLYTHGVNSGSVNAGNSFTGQDFGLVGRKRYALAADGGGGPRVQVFDSASGEKLRDFFVYEETFTGGVRVASGDVTGDGVDDLVVVAGPGGGPRVRVLDGVTGEVVYDFFVYEQSFRDGMFVAVGDVDGDGFADIVTGTAPGGGPRVAVFSGKTGERLADFFAFDPEFRGGVRIGAGDTNGDGKAEVITGAGLGGAPNVRVWNALPLEQLSSFFAFGEDFTGGIYVAGGAVRPDGRGTVIVGSGKGLPNSRIREFDQGGRLLTDTDAFSILTGPFTDEARVSSVDRNGDGTPDIAVASGPGGSSRIRFLDGRTKRQIGDELLPFEATFLGGVFIG